jgi:hypothetical protein
MPKMKRRNLFSECGLSGLGLLNWEKKLIIKNMISFGGSIIYSV